MQKNSFKYIFATLLLAVACVAGAQPTLQVTDREETRFVIFGDSQFANKGMWERMVYEINLLRPDFTIQVGDLIQGYKYDKDLIRKEWELFFKQIEPIEVPYYPVPGNHDVANSATHAIYEEIWGTDRYYYSFDIGPSHHVVLDSYWPDEMDQIGDWQLEWMAEDLAEYAEENGGIGSDELSTRSIFVYMHSPVWRYEEARPEGYASWVKMHEILKQYPTKLVVGGHTHEYVWEQHDGIDYVVINSSGSMAGSVERAGYFQGYIHVSVDNQGSYHAGVIRAGSIYPVDMIDSTDRERGASLNIPSKTIRFVPPAEGPIDSEFVVDIPNNAKEERTFKLTWDVPRDSIVSVYPREGWVDLGPDDVTSMTFRMTAPEVPASEDMYPTLRVTSQDVLRTGAVPRDAEAELRARNALAATDPNIIPSNIALEEPVTYSASWPIFLPLVATAHPRTGDILIDGKIDDTAWRSADPITDFKIGDGEAPEQMTRVYVLYDDKYLYVAAYMEEPNPEGMRADAEGPIALTWADDDFELFFDTSMEQKEFYRLFQNYVGTRFNARPLGYDDRYFTSTYESDIHVGEDYWSLEMKIPYEETGAETAPEAGTQWGFNIWRHRTQTGEAPFWWASSGYSANRLGILQFE